MGHFMINISNQLQLFMVLASLIKLFLLFSCLMKSVTNLICFPSRFFGFNIYIYIYGSRLNLFVISSSNLVAQVCFSLSNNCPRTFF